MNRPAIAAFILLAFVGGLGGGYLAHSADEAEPVYVADLPGLEVNLGASARPTTPTI